MNDKSQTIETWWTDYQIELANNSSKIWERKTFESIDGVWEEKNGKKVLRKLLKEEILLPDAIIENKAWDHEHCELCWKKISKNKNEEQEGYYDGKNWLCIECFDKYILKNIAHS